MMAPGGHVLARWCFLVAASSLGVACDGPVAEPPAELTIARGTATITVNTAVLPRPAPVVDAVYQFVADHGTLVAHIPCYCSCELEGHRSSQDCFIKARSATGEVLEWSPHGATCAMCVAVVERAMIDTAARMAPQSIREEIERRFAHLTSHRTETPEPER